MSDLKVRLHRNALWMVLSRFGAQGFAVIFTILLARRLGSTGFGEFAFIAAVIFIANALTTFGTDMLLIRQIAATGDLSRLTYALMLQLVLSILFISVLWMSGAWVPNQGAETLAALKIYSLALVPLAFFTVFTTALRGVQRMEMYAILNLIVSALQVGIVLSPTISIVRLSVLLLAVQIAAAILAGFICSRAIQDFWKYWRFDSFELPSFLKEAAPIAFLTVLTMLYQRLNVTILSVMIGATPTGLYSAAFRAVEASKTAHLALFAALYPAMASEISLRALAARGNLLVNEEIAPRRLTAKYPKLMIAGATVISLLLFILAKPLVNLLYGNEFDTASGVLQILAWSLVPFTINTYLILSLLASNQERLVGRALTVSLLGLLILNLWWIPAGGPGGSAWAALIAECIQSVILLAGRRARVFRQGTAHEFSELS